MNSKADADLPGVSVVVAVRNEATHIDRCVEALLKQDYPPDKLEFIFVDGCSSDATVEHLKAWREKDERISVLTNDKKITSAGMNLGMAASRFDYLLWISGHAILQSDHVRRCVETLLEQDAAAVGGILRTEGTSQIGRLNAAVLSHPFGVGMGEHRVGSESGWVFAVTMALYRKAALKQVGGWDETLPRNQDNELHVRLGNTGFRSYLNAEINPTYLARDTLSELLKQAWKNGFWSIAMSRRDSSGFHLRHFVPLLFVMSLLISLVVSFFIPACWWIVVGLLGLYLIAALVAAVHICVKRKWLWQFFALPMWFFLLHGSYGLGSIGGLLSKQGKHPASEPDRK